MAYLAKDKNKAKYLVRSTKPCGTKMQEFCDNLDLVRGYKRKIEAEGRENVVVWTRTTVQPRRH